MGKNYANLRFSFRVTIEFNQESLSIAQISYFWSSRANWTGNWKTTTLTKTTSCGTFGVCGSEWKNRYVCKICINFRTNHLLKQPWPNEHLYHIHILYVYVLYVYVSIIKKSLEKRIYVIFGTSSDFMHEVQRGSIRTLW